MQFILLDLFHKLSLMSPCHIFGDVSPTYLPESEKSSRLQNKPTNKGKRNVRLLFFWFHGEQKVNVEHRANVSRLCPEL